MRQIPAMLLAASLAALSHSQAAAADAEGNFAIRGIGAQSCGAVVEAINGAGDEARAEIVLALSTWLGGYLTHANRVIAERFDAVPFVSDVDMLAIVVDRCEAAPEALFETAAQDILAVLAPVGVGAMSEVAEVDDSVVLRVSTVQALQQALIDRGFLEGAADGVVGPMTRSAVQRFNADQGIDAGNTITIETVLRAFAEE